MRTSVDIDETLLEQAMAAAGLTTKQATVEAGLRRLIDEHSRRAALDDLAGIGWDGDLDAMRRGEAAD